MFHDFHFVIYSISLYECEAEAQWVKLSPNKCLIIFPFLSRTTFTAPHWKYTPAQRGPLSVCWVVYEIFLKDGGYSVTAAKVMKRANSKLQSEDSCIVRRSIVKLRYMYVFWKMYQGLRSLRRKSGIIQDRNLSTFTARDTQSYLYIFRVGGESTKRVLLSYLHLGGMRWLCCGGRELI